MRNPSLSGRADRLHRLSGAAILTVAITLSACGSDSDPAPLPLATVAHPITATKEEAAGLAGTVTRGSRGGLRAMRDLDAFGETRRLVELLFPRLFGADVSEDGSSIEVDCRINPLRLAPLGLCYGKFQFVSNRREQNGQIMTGTVFSLQFDNFNLVTAGFERLRISGGFRVDYLTDYSASPRTGTVRYTSGGLTSNRSDAVIQPRNGALTVIYGDGRTIIEGDSRRYLDINASISGDLSGSLQSGTVRTNFQSGYVDIAYSNWTLIDGLVQVGSVATITGTDGTLATLTVVASSADTVTFEVTITVGGSAEPFTIDIPASELLRD